MKLESSVIKQSRNYEISLRLSAMQERGTVEAFMIWVYDQSVRLGKVFWDLMQEQCMHG